MNNQIVCEKISLAEFINDVIRQCIPHVEESVKKAIKMSIETRKPGVLNLYDPDTLEQDAQMRFFYGRSRPCHHVRSA